MSLMWNDAIFDLGNWLAFTAVMTVLIFVASAIVFVIYSMLIRFAVRQLRGKGLH